MVHHLQQHDLVSDLILIFLILYVIELQIELSHKCFMVLKSKNAYVLNAISWNNFKKSGFAKRDGSDKKYFLVSIYRMATPYAQV